MPNTQHSTRSVMGKSLILLVDDNPRNLQVLGHLLEGNYRTAIAQSGRGTLEFVKKRLPDLILLDIMMPGMDGFEVCARLKASPHTRDIPIIFLTAKTETEDMVKGFEVGAVDYITKPFRPEIVFARVNTYLSLRNLQKELQEKNRRLQQEIIEHKQTNESLRKLSRAVEQSTSSIVITDLEGIIEFVNPAFCKHTGYSYEEAIGQNSRVIQSGQHPSEFYQELWGALESGEVWQGEFVNKKKNGELYWELATISPIKDPDGAITHYLDVKDDITTRKQAEEALQQRNRELALLHRLGQAVGSSLELERILETALEEIRNLIDVESASFWLRIPETDEIECKQAIGAGREQRLHQRLKLEEGITGWVAQHGESQNIPDVLTDSRHSSTTDQLTGLPVRSMLSIPLHVKGHIIGVLNLVDPHPSRFTLEDLAFVEPIAATVAIAIDNARLFADEQQQRQIAESLREVSVALNSSLDLETVLQRILEQLWRVVPYDSAAIFLQEDDDHLVLSQGAFIHKIFLGRHLPFSRPNSIIEVFQRGEPFIIPDVREESAWELWDESVKIRSWVGVPLFIGGKAIGVLTADSFEIDTYHEEDAQILQIFAHQSAFAIHNARLFEETRRSRVIAEAANRTKSEFLANVSHEIRTPMNAILGFSELLVGAIEDTEQQHWLRNILSSGKTLLSLINDILDLSKIEAGRLEIQLEPVNLRELLREIEMFFSQTCSRKGLAWNVDAAPDLPQILLLDEVRIRQILVNLIGNAIKFTDKGRVTLRVTKVESDNPQSSIVNLQFSIEDTGIGIPHDQQEVIFENFRQQDGQLTRKYEGTGLGLAITKRLAELMNGEISVESEVGKGSIFRVLLPQAEVVSVDGRSAHAELLDNEERQVTFEPATLLLVEDVLVNRTLVKRYLKESPFTILEAESGEDALRLLARLSRQPLTPDLILMDLKMPGISGDELTRRLKQTEGLRSVPVVAVTASVLKETEEQMKLLFDGFLRKPFSREELLAELQKHLPRAIHTATSAIAYVEAAPGGQLSPEMISKFPDLIEVLEEELLPQWGEIRDTLIFDEVEKFVEQIKEQGQRYHCESLIRWSEAIIGSIRDVELEALSKIFEKFPDILQQLKTLIHES